MIILDPVNDAQISNAMPPPFLNKGLHAMEFCLQFVKQIPKKKNYSKDSSFPHLGSMNRWLQLATRSFRVRLFFFESVKSRINDLA